MDSGAVQQAQTREEAQWMREAWDVLQAVRDTLEEHGRITLDAGGRPLLKAISMLVGVSDE
jgi:hypothetical protein